MSELTRRHSDVILLLRHPKFSRPHRRKATATNPAIKRHDTLPFLALYIPHDLLSISPQTPTTIHAPRPPDFSPEFKNPPPSSSIPGDCSKSPHTRPPLSASPRPRAPLHVLVLFLRSGAAHRELAGVAEEDAIAPLHILCLTPPSLQETTATTSPRHRTP